MQDLNPASSAGLRVIIRKLSQLNEERTRLIFSVVHGKSLIHGMPHNVYKKCGKKNCRCSKGHLHGPYQALSINKNGKQKVVMLKKDGDAHIQKRAKRFRYFQETLAKIRRINREVDYLLNIIKINSTIR